MTAEPMVWYEEYKQCGCSFVDADRTKLPGYCPKHANDKRRRLRLPAKNFQPEDYGYAG